MELFDSDEQKIIRSIIKKLTEEINEKKEYILGKIGNKLHDPTFSFQQFNGRFGSKNNTYVDSVRTKFLNFEDFYAQWLDGLMNLYDKSYPFHKNKNKDDYVNVSSPIRNLRLIQDDEIELFVKLFLKKNFYKKINERIREKPEEKLWTIWFGYNLTFGLIISPKRIDNIWINDKSEIRKTPYSYWTIGHVLAEGLIDPNLDKPYKFNSGNEFLIFYESILKRISISQYEQKFCDYYISYLKNSNNIENEPFLIPELRYAGLNKKHKHRLDFTILNPYTLEYTGFEISPSSSHINISNLKDKQNKVNDELRKKWDNEMEKRNDYFENYGITTITFTDSMLDDLDKCFAKVNKKLEARPKTRISLNGQLKRLKEI